MNCTTSVHGRQAPQRACLVASTLLVAAMLTLDASATGEREVPTDLDITNAIGDRLLLDDGVNAHAIMTATHNGITTLTGRVDSILAKQRAVALAQTIKGVRGVIDLIELDAPAIPNDDLQTDVETALILNPRTEAFEVSNSASDGEITLTGAVDSWQEREMVENVTSGVRGVTAVHNLVTVKTTVRTAQEIREDVRGALRWDRYVDDSLINIDVNDRTVVLTGTVGSAAERVRARRDAWVKGVKEVKSDELEVKFWARRDDLREQKYARVDDAALHDAIRTALRQDPRVLANDVEVAVNDRIVTLRGTVDYVGARTAAAQDARDIVGVLWVRDRLQVRPTHERSDDEIAQRVEAAWLRDPYLQPLLELNARAHDGNLRIEGSVNTTFDRIRAEQIANEIPGVLSVNNNIDVIASARLPYNPYLGEAYPYDFGWYSPTTTRYKPDAEIAAEVKDELWWSPFVDSDRVNVKVDQGVVTLTGTVDTWSERRIAVENALEGGAVKVVNQLSVSYGS